ncbi:hypothetical protein O9G_001210 [Rozella allomycis CSF55]|uniref:Uncharacterized protein n=1 Tax=Rozella allomycis (strain CSF55) TaxID=988480 RepID=A0A075AY09_ROZAC|nr:hypothetical protein O9G_001210 [Rozella allomycis CSF55]|eukprot:EPZ33459.1 hypothetical protein O9G_001210 [Rozella allomycis CSF55]
MRLLLPLALCSAVLSSPTDLSELQAAFHSKDIYKPHLFDDKGLGRKLPTDESFTVVLHGEKGVDKTNSYGIKVKKSGIPKYIYFIDSVGYRFTDKENNQKVMHELDRIKDLIKEHDKPLRRIYLVLDPQRQNNVMKELNIMRAFYGEEAMKRLTIIINKMDIIQEDEDTYMEMISDLKMLISSNFDIEPKILFVSAKTCIGQFSDDLFDAAEAKSIFLNDFRFAKAENEFKMFVQFTNDLKDPVSKKIQVKDSDWKKEERISLVMTCLSNLFVGVGSFFGLFYGSMLLKTIGLLGKASGLAAKYKYNKNLIDDDFKIEVALKNKDRIIEEIQNTDNKAAIYELYYAIDGISNIFQNKMDKFYAFELFDVYDNEKLPY